MHSPQITVGMPAYNRAKVLGYTIQMVLDQSFKDFEFIIYNDGSTDNTVDVIRSFHDDRIILLDQPNLGPPHPLNAIYQEAKGEYIIILHDHDFFHPQLLEKSLAALIENPDAGFVLQGSAWINEDGESDYCEMLLDLPPYNRGSTFGENMLADKISFSSIFHACCMVKRTALENAGMFYKSEFGLYADTDLWLRLLSKYDFIYLREVLFKFRTREVEGHFLNNRQVEILNWQKNIQKSNVATFFDRKRGQYIIKTIQNKYNISLTKVFIQSIALNNEVVFKNSLIALNNNPKQSILIKLFANTTSLPYIKSFFWDLIPFLNKWRKKFQKK